MAFDKGMYKQHRKVLLLLDDHSAHEMATPLKAVRLMFPPPNTSSVLQPLDKAIIRSPNCFIESAL